MRFFKSVQIVVKHARLESVVLKELGNTWVSPISAIARQFRVHLSLDFECMFSNDLEGFEELHKESPVFP